MRGGACNPVARRRLCTAALALALVGIPVRLRSSGDEYDAWVQLDRTLGRDAIPEFQAIPAAKPGELTASDGGDRDQDFRRWNVSQGDPGSRRYSALDQINRSNVAQLREAWIFHSRDGAGNIQSNPIVVHGVLFAPTVGHAIVALDASTGKEIWRRQIETPAVPGLEDSPARRGLVYWAGDSAHPARIVFSSGKWVYALDPATGEPLREFGDNGRAPLPTGGTTGGVIWRDTLVISGFSGDIFAYNLGNGAPLWRFHTIPRPGEFGAGTWIGQDRAGADCWGGLAMDVKRGIVYAAVGDPHPNYVGLGRAGRDLFSDSLVAIDVPTGRLLWYFQNVRHDLWDLDDPAPPNLVTLTIAGRRVDAIACVTKVGDTLLLDRVTGRPIFPFRFRRAPLSTLPGEVTAPYQPDPELPQPFSSEAFAPVDVTNLSPAARDFVLNQVRGSTWGWFVPATVGKPLLYRSSRGGAEWTGACIDVPTGRLYVSSNRVVSKITVFKSTGDGRPGLAPLAGKRTFEQYCAVCHGANRQGMGMVPPLIGLRHRMTPAQVLALLKTGRNAMPPAPAMPGRQLGDLLAFLMHADESGPHYYIGGFDFLKDPQGYPGIKPPWGLLTCIDLNTGKIQWRVPLGKYDELVKRGYGITGTENFGGPAVTAGGLVFCGGTRDGEIRAFDKDTGRELWSAKLPWGGYAPPAIYEAAGREFVVIAATGGGKLGGPTGDAYVAFALPRR